MPWIAASHLLRRALQDVEVVAEDLDADVAAHAGDQLVEAQLDRLRDFVAAAGNLVGGMLDLLDQLGLGLAPDPAIPRAASA